MANERKEPILYYSHFEGPRPRATTDVSPEYNATGFERSGYELLDPTDKIRVLEEAFRMVASCGERINAAHERLRNLQYRAQTEGADLNRLGELAQCADRERQVAILELFKHAGVLPFKQSIVIDVAPVPRAGL